MINMPVIYIIIIISAETKKSHLDSLSIKTKEKRKLCDLLNVYFSYHKHKKNLNHQKHLKNNSRQV